GGHSLLAMQVLSRVRELYGVSVGVRALFEAPTLAGFAAQVRTAQRDERGDQLPPLVPTERGEEPDLSFGQQRLWFVYQMDPASPAYNMPYELELDGEIDCELLRQCLETVVQRHEVLRTVFEEVKGTPRLRVLQDVTVHLPLADLSSLPETDNAVARASEAERSQPFDLSRDLMIRACLLRVRPTQHVLLLTLHHIAADAWSLEVLAQELSALYATARSRGSEALLGELPALPVQYADYAAWQKGWLKGELLDTSVDYWTEQLEALPELELPTDYPRPHIQKFRGASVSHTCRRSLAQDIEALAQQERTSPYVVILSALAWFLSLQSGQRDFALGAPVAGRNHSALEGLIGFFVNTVVLRMQVAPGDSFRETLRRIRQVVLEADYHQHLPFEHLVRVLNPRRDSSRHPLVQVLFSYQRALHDETTERAHSSDAAPVERQAESAKFDLLFDAVAGSDSVHLSINYDRDLFGSGTAEQFLENWAATLAGAVKEPERLLRDAHFLPSSTAAARTDAWNDTTQPYPHDKSIGELFKEAASTYPDAIAVSDGRSQVSYQALDLRTDRLARHLESLGVGLETPVGVCMQRGVATIEAWLAIAKAGAAYVPLDPTYPASRLAFMAEDAQIELVLTTGSVEAIAEELPVHRLLMEDVDSVAGSGTSHSTQPKGSSLNLAYMTYTSGSTGRPKGVMVPHQAVARLVRETDYIDLLPDDVVAHASSTTFDAATFEVWGALLTGARLHILSEESVLSSEEFAHALRAHSISTLFLTTALFNQHSIQQPGLFSTLRHVLTGGERADDQRIRDVLANDGPGRLLNVYGPTETTTFATWHEVDSSSELRAVPIGLPLANTTAYVLSPTLELLPPGVPGELFIGGPGVARGYAGRSALTAERFLPDPFGAVRGGRLYRTGDRVRRRRDGALEFLGRIDRQVKLRGFRVEPGEVEAALRAVEGVAEAAVEVRTGAGGTAALIGYASLRSAEVAAEALSSPEALTEAEAQLRDALALSLPSYLVPTRIVVMEALPKTPNGKLDRRALPTPAAVAVAGRAPTAGLEAEVAGVWEAVLGREVPSRSASFFELGGHSLLAMQVLSRVRELHGVSVGVRALFEAPTLAGFTERVAEAMSAGGDGVAGPLLVEAQETGVL
ncbi:MAG: amino acid adenylation domain-containing protein, partial [Bacteroidota bacterium]